MRAGRSRSSVLSRTAPHVLLRAAWARKIAAGEVVLCARADCFYAHLPGGRQIRPGMLWDLGHVDGGGPFEYAGPEHRRCNRATAGRRPRRRQSRVW